MSGNHIPEYKNREAQHIHWNLPDFNIIGNSPHNRESSLKKKRMPH